MYKRQNTLDIDSKLKDYKKFSRMSNIFVQLLLWSFSTYIGDDEITNETISKFISDDTEQVDNLVDQIDINNLPYLLDRKSDFFKGDKMLIDMNMLEKGKILTARKEKLILLHLRSKNIKIISFTLMLVVQKELT